MTILARLDHQHNLLIKGRRIEFWDAYDANQGIDDTYELDDDHTFDTNDEVSILINYLFGIENTETKVDIVRLTETGDFFLGELETGSNKFSLDSDLKMSVNQLFEHQELG